MLHSASRHRIQAFNSKSRHLIQVFNSLLKSTQKESVLYKHSDYILYTVHTFKPDTTVQDGTSQVNMPSKILVFIMWVSHNLILLINAYILMFLCMPTIVWLCVTLHFSFGTNGTSLKNTVSCWLFLIKWPLQLFDHVSCSLWIFELYCFASVICKSFAQFECQ